MQRFHRVTAPGVRDGRVRRKNNWRRTPNCYNTPQNAPAIDRDRPGRGYRHLLLKRDVERFLALLPDWAELSRGVNVVLLACGEPWLYGWYRPGIVALCAWPEALWQEMSPKFYADNRALLERLEVPDEELPGGDRLLKFTRGTARAFQLLDVLLHELGHHHDSQTNRSGRASRGEPYAEEYARRYAGVIWDRYLAEFRLD
jgi:hypothetical protein